MLKLVLLMFVFDLKGILMWIVKIVIMVILFVKMFECKFLLNGYGKWYFYI